MKILVFDTVPDSDSVANYFSIIRYCFLLVK